MGQRKVTILPKVNDTISELIYHIESLGMSLTARKFYTELSDFLEKLGDDFIERRDCPYKSWKQLGYKCIGYKKKYIIAFLSFEDEVVICDFVPYKLLKE